MTQIFGVVTRMYVFHVSDRLLTQRVGQAIVEFDRNSNKSVVFLAKDAHVVASYTGRAYLDGIPTDTFIARSLLGMSLPQSGAFISVGRPQSWTDIGRSVERLRQELSCAFQRLTINERSMDFQISILGWRQRQTRNKRFTPVVLEIRRAANSQSHEFQIIRHQRWWGWYKGYCLSYIPNVPQLSILEWMRNQFRGAGSKPPEEFKNILIEGLRRCFEAQPDTIGQACLQITLKPTAPHAQIHFIPNLRSPTGLSNGGMGYSPWIIAPPWAFAPAIIRGRGGWTLGPTGYSWVVEGATAGKSSHSSQRRPADPQGRR